MPVAGLSPWKFLAFCACACQPLKGTVDVSVADLIKISPEADAAFQAFDFSAYEGQNAVRIYLQGYG